MSSALRNELTALAARLAARRDVKDQLAYAIRMRDEASATMGVKSHDARLWAALVTRLQGAR